MKQRLSYVWVLVLATGSLVASACSDDSSSSTDDTAGSGGVSGSSAGGKTGGSAAGGSSSKAGNNSGGKAGSGGKSSGGSAGTSGVGATDGGAGGGVNDGGAGGNDTGAGGSAAGAGGAGEPALVYACGSDTLFQKTCSAYVALDCPDATICSDCVDLLTSERADFQNDPPCATCNAKYDAFYQCQVDAFESGMLDFGVECVEGYGADGTANCYPFLSDATDCEGYVGTSDPYDCPATWPPQ